MEEVTFVSALILAPDVLDSCNDGEKTPLWRLKMFDVIASTGAKFCIYGDAYTIPLLKPYSETHPNVKLMEMDYTTTEIYKLCSDSHLTLPNNRKLNKDTANYMKIMNSKIEFVSDAINKNPWNSNVFAWIDFSIAYIFRNHQATLEKIKKLSIAKYVDTFFAFPGCWTNIMHPDACADNISWRFSGSFFIGDKESILNFHKTYQNFLPEFFARYGKLMWEVNIWAWFEATNKFAPLWYMGNHNDTILDVPLTIMKTV